MGALWDRKERAGALLGAIFYGTMGVCSSAVASDRLVVGGFTIVESAGSCAAHADFPFEGRSDVKFAIASAGNRVAFAFHSLDWTRPAEGTEVALQFLGRGGDVSASFKGLVRPNTYAGVYDGFVATLDSGSLDDFATAHSLMVAREGDVITYLNLEGSARAAIALRQCFERVQRRVHADAEAERVWDYIEKDPFAAPPAADAIRKPGQWSRPPRPARSDAPQQFRDHGGAGSATLDCLVDTRGQPGSCRIISEAPEGFGLGEAAIRSIARAQAAPHLVGERIQSVITFPADD